MNELVRRNIKKTLEIHRLTKEEAAVNRSLFLKELMESNGQSLLKYVEVVPKSSNYTTSEVYRHIKQKAKISLNNIQLSYLKHYLQQIGVDLIKKEDAFYFTKIKLKE